MPSRPAHRSLELDRRRKGCQDWREYLDPNAAGAIAAELGVCSEMGRLLVASGPQRIADMARRLSYPVETIETCLAREPSWFKCVGGMWSATAAHPVTVVRDLR